MRLMGPLDFRHRALDGQIRENQVSTERLSWGTVDGMGLAHVRHVSDRNGCRAGQRPTAWRTSDQRGSGAAQCRCHVGRALPTMQKALIVLARAFADSVDLVVAAGKKDERARGGARWSTKCQNAANQD